MRAFPQSVTALVCSTAVVAAQCYFPNGGQVDSDTACNPNALVSACCFDGQACLSNGLCVSDPHDSVKARLHRGTCTDKQWKSGNCPRHCLDIDNNGVPVYSCNTTSTDSYCCYDGCDCQANSAFEIFTFAQSPADVYTITIIGESFTQTHTSSASSIAAASSTPVSATANSAFTTIATTGSSVPTASISSLSATSTSAAAPAAEPEKKSNTTALGAGLGVGIPVAALIGVGIFFLLRRRKNQYTYSPPSELTADEYHLNHTSPSTKYAHAAEAEMTTPASAAPVTHELSGERTGPAELPAESAPSTAGGAGAVELESPLSSPGEGTRRVA